MTEREQEILLDLINKLQGADRNVRRAQTLFKANASGAERSDERIAETFGYRC